MNETYERAENKLSVELLNAYFHYCYGDMLFATQKLKPLFIRFMNDPFMCK